MPMSKVDEIQTRFTKNKRNELKVVAFFESFWCQSNDKGGTFSHTILSLFFNSSTDISNQS